MLVPNITVDLKAASLTHATGRSDKCENKHDVPMTAVIAFDDSGLIDPDSVSPVLQALHEQAHPEGTLTWQYCLERGCAEANELLPYS
jgi:hypothetical protein